ncbi:MAG: Eco57I restriction-modification methylase domain-containing protein [Clostridiales bacterium]|nr:Eco57I restriction-modification methylase domain-containing protein [Clostridiales bacterium]
MDEIFGLRSGELCQVYDILLMDKTTGQRIVWGSDSYLEYGDMYGKDSAVTASFDGLRGFTVEPRMKKEKDRQQERTRSYAEVFTPAWVCNKMINFCDEEWFGRKGVFNSEGERSWSVNKSKIEFSGRQSWKAYVDLRRLEITCGEAPYIVSPYDASTGEKIEIENRIGILDRKLRVVGENCENEEEWLKWAERAFQSVYGYEIQGDNLILCRKNLLLTFGEYLKHRWNREPTLSELKKTANIIAWNFWQMDGLKGTVPLDCAKPDESQLSLDDFFENSLECKENVSYECKIHNWRSGKTFLFREVKEKGFMKFSYVIGNPPYQEDRRGTSTTAMPVYHEFIDAAYNVGKTVELITPARFLFNVGRTPKQWNQKMLNDTHFKVLHYESNASLIFPNTEIKGGGGDYLQR